MLSSIVIPDEGRNLSISPLPLPVLDPRSSVCIRVIRVSLFAQTNKKILSSPKPKNNFYPQQNQQNKLSEICMPHILASL
jgi:hypothetical protein